MGFDNTGGAISALTGSEVQLTNGAFVLGGTLNTAGTGVVRNLDIATLSGLTNAGAFIANNGSTTILIGTITNKRSLTIFSTGSFTDLTLSGNVTLNGGGTLLLSSADRLRGSGILTNVNNIIQGETNSGGSLGMNEIGIINQAGGVIDANVAGLALVVDPNSADGLVNHGLMRASNGGILLLTGSNGGGFTNNNLILATGAGSEVQLTSGASIFGGTLNTASGGLFRNLNSATLSGLTNAGAFFANNGSTTTLIGTITNSGSLTIGSTGSFTDLSLAGSVTLTGGGILNLTSADRVRGSGILTNVNNTIQGETTTPGAWARTRSGSSIRAVA